MLVRKKESLNEGCPIKQIKIKRKEGRKEGAAAEGENEIDLDTDSHLRLLYMQQMRIKLLPANHAFAVCRYSNLSISAGDDMSKSKPICQVSIT